MQKAFVIYKLSGAGNTFAFVDARQSSAYADWEKLQNLQTSAERTERRRQLVQHICSPVNGLACDGFVFMEQNQDGWIWDFYNNDGSAAEMCGNAARCAMLFVRGILGRKVKNLPLQTKSGKIFGNEIGRGIFEITMTSHFQVLKEIKKDVAGRQIDLTLMDTGVPHLVFDGDPLSKTESSRLRQDLSISPAGSNVTSYLVVGDGHIQAVTFERGVEDFTLACGTGAVAAALDYWRKSHFANKPHWIKVKMPGGQLEVYCSQKEKSRMRGSAAILLKAKINKEYL